MTNDVKKVPELRFPEFSGEWRERRLGDIAIIKGRLGWKGLKNEEYIENGYAYLVAGRHIKNGVINWSSTDQINKYRYDESPEIALEQNDIIFSKDGSLGNPALIKSMNKPATINGTMMLVRVDTNKLNPHFFYQILLSSYFKRLIHLKVSGSSIPHLFQDDMKAFSIKATNLSEQEKIGCFFSKLDRQIELEEQKLAKLEEQKKGYMQKIFSQELIFKDENGNEYSKWEEVKLQNIANIKKGEQIKKENIDNNGKYYHLNGGTTASNRTNLFNTNPFTISISEGGNSCGFIKMNKEYFFSGGHNYTLLDLSVSNYYLYAYLKYHEKNIMSLRVGSGLPNIQKKDISNYLIKIPSKEEQEKIGIFFLKFDELIDTQRKKIEVLKKQKNGFLQKMFV